VANFGIGLSFDALGLFDVARPVGLLCEPSARSSYDCALAARAPFIGLLTGCAMGFSFDPLISFDAPRSVGRLCAPSARSSHDCALGARAPCYPRLVVRLRAGSTRSLHRSFDGLRDGALVRCFGIVRRPSTCRTPLRAFGPLVIRPRAGSTHSLPSPARRPTARWQHALPSSVF